MIVAGRSPLTIYAIRTSWTSCLIMSNKQHKTGKQNVGTTKELPTVISFCSGYGGIERGLDLAGINHKVIAYVEVEAFAIANLVAKMEAGQLAPAPIWTDIKTFPSEIFSGKVDLITGGYPCQPFSAAGERKGVEDERHLWPYIRKHIKAVKPNRCFFENVEGHISLGLSTVISDLAEDGFRTAWGIFSAREVGAPHQRKRVYIMADCQGEFSQRAIKTRSVERQPEKEVRKRSLFKGTTTWLSKCKQGIHEWPTEPRVGRVVDGCPDRLDRIRLLGNGVVPQTAAKAWLTLTEQV